MTQVFGNRLKKDFKVGNLVVSDDERQYLVLEKNETGPATGRYLYRIFNLETHSTVTYNQGAMNVHMRIVSEVGEQNE